MSDSQYREFLNLLMCADPWPVSDDGSSQSAMVELATSEAQKRGFRTWIDAYYEFKQTHGGD